MHIHVCLPQCGGLKYNEEPLRVRLGNVLPDAAVVLVLDEPQRPGPRTLTEAFLQAFERAENRFESAPNTSLSVAGTLARIRLNDEPLEVLTLAFRTLERPIAMSMWVIDRPELTTSVMSSYLAEINTVRNIHDIRKPPLLYASYATRIIAAIVANLSNKR